MRNKVFAVTIVVILLLFFISPPTNRVLCSLGVVRHSDIGNIIAPERVYEEDSAFGVVLNRIEEGKAAVTDLYTNYFPFYNDIVAGVQEVLYTVNEPMDTLLTPKVVIAPPAETDSLLADDADGVDEAEETAETAEMEEIIQVSSVTARPLDNSDSRNIHRYYSVDLTLTDGRQVKLLERAVDLDEETRGERLKENIEQLNRICSYRTDDVNYYVYAATRTQDTEFSQYVMPDEPSTKEDFELLFASLPESTRYDYLRFDSIDDRLNLAYLTDHHWTADGIYEGYCQILDMMRLDTPDIGDPYEHGELLTAPGIRFYGSLARVTSYYSLNDDLTFYRYNLPEHTLRGGNGFEEQIDKFMSRQIRADRGSALYEELYPDPLQITYKENETGRNLLLIGDSYARGMCELIAAHFDTTYLYFPDRPDCDLDTYIDKYGVTDVLFLMYSDRLLYRIYGQLDWNNYITGE